MTINNKQPQPSIPINKIKRFEDFFRLFQEKPTEFKYRDKISNIYAEGDNTLEFLFEDLNAFDPALAEMLKNNPEDVIPDIIEAFKNLLKFHAPGGKLKDEIEYFIQISTDNDSNLVLLRGLRSKHIDKLIFTRGILLRASTVRPKLENAIYKCLRCDAEFPQIQLSNTLIWPNHCVNPKCKANTQKDFIFISKKSDFIDWQKITIQETPEELPAGRIPRSIDGILIKDLVDKVRPGDRVKIMGVFKSLPQKNVKGKGSLIFRIFIDVNSIKSSDKEDKDFYPTPEELKQIKELAAEPYIQRKIARSIAPSIYGREDLKLATALCLFGGNRLKKIDGTYRRGDIHVLFVGDPGTGKSEILKAAVNVSPRALYTSGKGSTAVGLCVSGDSKVFLSDNIQPISQIVEEEFKKAPILKYNENINYKESKNCLEAYHSKDLSLEKQPISKVWRIKSPPELVKITTRTGRELKLTGQTSVLSIDQKLGLVWRPSNSLKKSDRVATLGILPILSTKQPPSIYNLIKDYPKNIYIFNISQSARELIAKIKYKFKISNSDLAAKLKIHENTIYRWKNTSYQGGIPLNKFNKLCTILNEDIKSYLPQILVLQIKRGQTIILPKNLDEKWFYILGLIIGDGRVSLNNSYDGYRGVTIGFSNREETLLNEFMDFFKQLGLKSNISKQSEKRAAEYRIHSSLIFHILSKFGLSPSPKSNKITLNPDIFFYPKIYLSCLLRGLFDSDGWISISKSSHIGFSSTSKNLIQFVQDALLTFGIIGFIRKREPKITILSDGRKIIGKNIKYELIFSAYSEFVLFKKYIGFNHPKKKFLLEKYCHQEKSFHRNIDNIPEVSLLIKKILDFYGYHSRDLFGRKGALSPSNLRKTMSRERILSILKKIKLDWCKHRVILNYEIRNQLYRELLENLTIDIVQKYSKLSKEQLYEYFMRKGRKPSIPIGVFYYLINKAGNSLKKQTKKYWLNYINTIKKQHETYVKKYNFLKTLCNSDIFWDEIIKVEEISTKEPFVYDLTIPQTHNFIVNGIVVHNTAAVVKDPDTGTMSLEAGAIVLADGGIAAIDEFDKMESQDIAAIHEAMAQQTVSIAKAGIIATLRAQTGIIAAGNPYLGRYNKYKTPTENIRQPPTLLSRFDLIFIVIDEPDKAKDAQLAEFILEQATGDFTQISQNVDEPLIPINHDLLKKYIHYARNNCFPVLTQEAKDKIKEYYLDLRGKYDAEQAIVSILARNLEALIRLSESYTKMALRDKVLVEDVEEIIKIFNRYLRDVGYDESTGKFDIDRIFTGQTRSKINKITKILDRIKNMINENDGKAVEIENVIEILEIEEDLDREFIEETINQAVKEGTLYKPRNKYIKFVDNR